MNHISNHIFLINITQKSKLGVFHYVLSSDYVISKTEWGENIGSNYNKLEQ